MSRRLNTYVHAVERDDRGNTTQAAVFGPDDEVPDWAQTAITNPDVWADDEDAGPAAEPDKPAKPARARASTKQQ
jgi:hypothetical protein